MNEEIKESFNKTAFLSNFLNMEDIAVQAISSFVENLPMMLKKIENAIATNNTSELEITAHTIKGTISAFYAEPARMKAWQLEQMGQNGNTIEAKNTFNSLTKEIQRLEFDLKTLLAELLRKRGS